MTGRRIVSFQSHAIRLAADASVNDEIRSFIARQDERQFSGRTLTEFYEDGFK